MRRRINEGTVHPTRWKGKIVSWRGLASYVDPETGERHRRSVSRRTKGETERALRALIAELPRTPVTPRPRTAQPLAFPPPETEGTMHALLARWLEYKSRDVRASTFREYVRCLRLTLPHLGETPPEQLSVLDVEHLMDTLCREHTPKAAGRVRRILSMALRQGVRWQVLGRNVAEAVRSPKVQKTELQVWTPEQVRRFLKAAETHRLYPLFALALSTGLRRGELLALQWRDLDLEGRTLTVRHTLTTDGHGRYELGPPKTSAGLRRVVLAPDTARLLERHRRAERRGHRAPATEDFVFTGAAGRYVEPRHLAKAYARITEQAGLPRIRFHDLRHTAASLLMRRGVAAKVVADRLGHADVRFTLQVYTHLYDDQRAEAALPMDELLGSAPDRARPTPGLAAASPEALRALHAALGMLLSADS